MNKFANKFLFTMDQIDLNYFFHKIKRVFFYKIKKSFIINLITAKRIEIGTFLVH